MTERPEKDGQDSGRGKSQKTTVLIIVNLIIIALGITMIIDGLTP